MRIFFLMLVLWFSCYSLFAQRERPKLIIYTLIERVSGYEDKGLLDLYSDHLISKLRSAINKEFPCLIVYSMNDLATTIKHDRDRALLQPGYESNLQEIAGAMGADYLVVVEIKSDGKLTSLSSSLLNPGKGEVKEKDNTILKKVGEDVFDEMDDYVRKYVEEMAKSEICPFKGKLSLVTTSEYKDEKQNQTSSEDGKYSTSYKFTHIIEEKDIWELDKVSWHGANGDMKHTQKDEEKSTSTSKGRCLRYEDGSWVDIFEGWGNSSENYEEKYKSDISGLANASNMDTKYPAIVEIQFDKKSGTYMVHVYAVSQTGKEYKTVYHQQNYSCPGPPFKTINEKDIPYPKELSIDKTFGPFPGKPSDKKLTQTININEVSEDGKGKSTQTLSFNFSR